jgi:alpha-glucosidase
VRPLWWQSPADRALRECGDTFLLGDALLVAPVMEPGSVTRAVRLPRGLWYDTVTGEALRGPGQVLLDAPLDRVPVLARAGAVLPVAGPDGGVELEVWAPRPGRAGGGVVFSGDPEGWGAPRMERFTTRWEDGELVVERDGGQDVGYAVRERGKPS